MLNYDDIYRIAMFGHRDFYAHRQLEERLIPLLRDLIRKHKFIEISENRHQSLIQLPMTIKIPMSEHSDPINFIVIQHTHTEK